MDVDKSYVYRFMPEEGLKKLRSQKHNRLMKISGDYSWFSNQEKRRLRQQIASIDAELNCRVQQDRLF